MKKWKWHSLLSPIVGTHIILFTMVSLSLHHSVSHYLISCNIFKSKVHYMRLSCTIWSYVVPISHGLWYVNSLFLLPRWMFYKLSSCPTCFYKAGIHRCALGEHTVWTIQSKKPLFSVSRILFLCYPCLAL